VPLKKRLKVPLEKRPRLPLKKRLKVPLEKRPRLLSRLLSKKRPRPPRRTRPSRRLPAPEAASPGGAWCLRSG